MKQCNYCDRSNCKVFEGNNDWPKDRNPKSKEAKMSPQLHRTLCSNPIKPKNGFPLIEQALNYPANLHLALSALPFKVQVQDYFKRR